MSFQIVRKNMSQIIIFFFWLRWSLNFLILKMSEWLLQSVNSCSEASVSIWLCFLILVFLMTSEILWWENSFNIFSLLFKCYNRNCFWFSENFCLWSILLFMLFLLLQNLDTFFWFQHFINILSVLTLKLILCNNWECSLVCFIIILFFWLLF